MTAEQNPRMEQPGQAALFPGFDFEPDPRPSGKEIAMLQALAEGCSYRQAADGLGPLGVNCQPCADRGRVSGAARLVAGTPMCAGCFAGKHVVRRDDLHPAQLALLQGIADGKDYRTISEELDHPLSYVRYMTSAGPSGIDVRMHVPNIDAAMALALTLGWID